MTTLPLLVCCLWIVAANLAGMLPCREGHWPAATVLIATGVPLLGLVTLQYGPVAGFLALGIGASMLRWPIRLDLARLRRRQGPAVHPERPAHPAE